MKQLNILGICGSLRQGSLNRKLLQAAAARVPEGMTITIADISGVPLFNADLEATPPPAVEALRKAITEADGVILATPEYNRSFSGVLKNIIDWGSRPNDSGVWGGKPLAVVGASPGNAGTAVAQYQLNPVLAHLGAHVLARDFFMGNAEKKFAEDGSLTDEDTAQHIAALLQAFQEYIHVFQEGGAA